MFQLLLSFLSRFSRGQEPLAGRVADPELLVLLTHDLVQVDRELFADRVRFESEHLKRVA